MYRVNKKQALHKGKPIRKADNYNLEFTMWGTNFTYPVIEPTQLNPTHISIISNKYNELYLDFNDGYGVRTYLMEANKTFIIPELRYADIPEDISVNRNWNYNNPRIVKLRFKVPESITSLIWTYVGVRGNFPNNIKNYPSIRRLNLTWLSEVNNFPSDIISLNLDALNLNIIFKNRLTKIPEFILNGRVVELSLTGSLDLYEATPESSGFNRLHNIKDLKLLSLYGCRVTESLFLDDNYLANIPSLVDLSLRSHLMTVIPKAITNAIQLEVLHIGGPNLRSLGDEIGNLINLRTITISESYNLNVDLPSTFKNLIKLKYIDYHIGLNTIERFDTFIRSIYIMTTETSLPKMIGITSSDSFWYVSLLIHSVHYSHSQVTNVPSGIYQEPQGYIQGSNNGTPQSPMEMIWVLVKQYRWTVRMRGRVHEELLILAP